MRSILAVSLAVCAALLTAVAPASAGTLSRSGNVYTFTAAPGETNQMSAYTTFSRGQWDVVINDTNPITPAAGSGCAADASPSGRSMRCQFGTNPNVHPGFAIDLGDMDDAATLTSPGDPGAIAGGPGNDTLASYGGADVLDGGPGDDTFYPENGVGSTVVPPTRGADTLIPGDGRDELVYTATGQPLTLTFDGKPGDTPDGDNVFAGFERVTGTEFDDTIVGTDADDYVEGAAGNDVLVGAGGADNLIGGAGNDTLDGGAGRNSLIGEGQDDRIIGGPDSDFVFGDGPNTPAGQEGNDRLELRDGVGETADCGPGTDVLVADQNDRDQGTTCETIDRATVPTPPPAATPLPGPGTTPTATGGIVLRSTTLRRPSSRRIRVALRCTAVTTCVGRLTVRTRGTRPRTIATRTYRLAAGRASTVTLKVGPGGRSRLGSGRARRVAVKLTPRGGRSILRRAVVRRS